MRLNPPVSLLPISVGALPPIAHAERLRSRLIFWAGDSGLLSYREKSASQPTIDLEWVARWSNICTSIEAGASPKDWVIALNEFIHRNQDLLEEVDEVVEDPRIRRTTTTWADPSALRHTGKTMLRFPADVHCFVFDNLNGCTLASGTEFELNQP